MDYGKYLTESEGKEYKDLEELLDDEDFLERILDDDWSALKELRQSNRNNYKLASEFLAALLNSDNPGLIQSYVDYCGGLLVNYLFYGTNITHLIIPEGITNIGMNLCCECKNLTSVKLPKTLYMLGSCCFERCENLEQVILPEDIKLTNIPFGTFAYCSGLQKIQLPKNIRVINGQAFFRCYSLREINIPDGVTSIGDKAFLHCKALHTLKLPESVKSIGEDCFYDTNIDDLYYGGTEEEFYDLLNKHNHSFVSSLDVVHCSDGDINFKNPDDYVRYP